jgi:hypothetical protein
MDTCKICGAPRDPLTASCKFCSTAYTLEKITGETYINALRNILQNLTSESAAAQNAANSTFSGQMLGRGGLARKAHTRRQVAAISTFAMPADIDNLMQFFTFCHGNAQISVMFHDHCGSAIKGAWFGKSKMAYSQLKLKALSNPEIAAYLSEYESLYGVAAKPPMSPQTKVLRVIGAIFAILFILIIGMSILFDRK